MRCKLEPHGNGIAVSTPFSRGFVYDLKEAIPSHEREWDGDNKVWIVAPQHGHTVAALCRRYFSDDPPVPIIKASSNKKRGTIRLLYVGAAKEREDGSSLSFGMHFDTKKWSVVFPENVLRNWFDGDELEGISTSKLPTSSYYLILGLKTIVNDQNEIKSAYRRMARQWHPDVCKEPDANERFKLINEAYQTLSDPPKKKLYDLGQKMVDSAVITKKKSRGYMADYDNYKPALRCGVIDCDYEVVLSRAVVSRIYSWNDIVDDRGRVLVTSWMMGAKEPTVAWV